MSLPKELKKQFRREALARRDSLDPVWRVEQALRIAEIANVAVQPDQVVSGYWPMRSEVDVRPLMFSLAEKRARICLPAILDKTTMIFRELVRGLPMVEMGFGTFGPGEDAEVLDPSIMLVPLAAFDARGHRIGYGGGYYDRAIEKLVKAGKPPHLIGIAFNCQEVERVPDEPHDVILAEILTESGLRHFAPPQ